MFQVTDEITSQPQCWSRAAELATQASTARALPETGARVAVIGCGTSLYMAQSFAALREGLGQGETDAFAASEFASQRGYDHVVALTRSSSGSDCLRPELDARAPVDWSFGSRERAFARAPLSEQRVEAVLSAALGIANLPSTTPGLMAP